MVRRVALVSAILLILAGCTAGRPVPAPVISTPTPLDEAPPVVSEPAAPSPPPVPEEPCQDRRPDGVYGLVLYRYVARGTCTTLVDSDGVSVLFFLTRGVSEATARAALAVTGPVQPEVRFFEAGQGWPEPVLQLGFPPGKPGERIEVHLAGQLGEGGAPVDLGFALERVPTPVVKVEWRQNGGEWRPLDHLLSLPRRATDLRFQIEGQVPLRTVDGKLRGNKIPDGEWVDGVTVRTLPEPPGHIFLDLNYIRTNDGLSTDHSFWEVFFGAPPQLVALDPSTGTEQPIGEAPLNTDRGSLSPDGRWAVFYAVQEGDLYNEEAWVLDAVTGRLVRPGILLDPPFIWTYWSGEESLIINDGRVAHWNLRTGELVRVETQSGGFPDICLNGRTLVGYAYDMRRADKNYLAPATIILYDVATHQERRVAEDQVRIRAVPSSLPTYLWMDCTADGRAVMIREPLPAPPVEQAYHWVRLDLLTGEINEAPDYTPAQDWLAGPAGYQVKVESGYALVTIRAPEATLRTYGEGRVIGWLPDGRLAVVRWENADDLRKAFWGE